jgi:hypothetical protein
MVAARSRCVVDVEAEGRLRHDLCGVQRRREVGRDQTRGIDRGGRGREGRPRRVEADVRTTGKMTYQVFLVSPFFLGVETT